MAGRGASGWYCSAFGVGALLVAFVAGAAVGGAGAATERIMHASVSVSKSGSGSGKVVGRAPVGDGIETQLDCGSQCRATITDATDPLYQPYSMTATPDPGSTFEGWSGACSGRSRTCTISNAARLANYSATAKFDRTYAPEYPVVVALEGQGSVSSAPDGITCGTTCSAIFKTFLTVTLTATPAEDWTFGGWTGDCKGTEPCAVYIDNPKTVKAIFNPPTYDLSVAVAGLGDVTSAPAGVNCGTVCKGKFQTGSTVVLTATPREGATFVGWSGACTDTAPTCTVTMTEGLALTATFSEAPGRPLAVVATGEGDIASTPGGIDCGEACGTVFPNGQRVTLTATARPESQFVRWGGSCQGSSRSCVVSMTAARAVTAIFSETGRTQVLAVSTSGKGAVRSAPAGIDCGAKCAAAFDTGTPVKLTAFPAAKMVFVGWSGACSGKTKTCSFTMTGPQTVSAQFALAADQKPPRARALPSTGDAGTIVRLRYRVSDDSGRTREQVLVFDGPKKIATLQGRLHVSEADALFYFLPWQPALDLAGKSFRFCVLASDAAGNKAPRTCSTVKVT